MAASLLAGTVLGAAGGWFGHGLGSAGIDPMRTEFFNLPGVTRAADDCTALRLGAGTRTVVLRIPGLGANDKVIAADAQLQALASGGYSGRMQPDGSYVLSLDARLLSRNRVFLLAQSAAGSREPVGCIERGPAPR